MKTSKDLVLIQNFRADGNIPNKTNSKGKKHLRKHFKIALSENTEFINNVLSENQNNSVAINRVLKLLKKDSVKNFIKKLTPENISLIQKYIEFSSFPNDKIKSKKIQLISKLIQKKIKNISIQDSLITENKIKITEVLCREKLQE